MLEETAVSSAKIMERMEATLGNLEQMSYDTINTTDQLVTLLGKAREYNMQMRDGTEADRAAAEEAAVVEDASQEAECAEEVKAEENED